MRCERVKIVNGRGAKPNHIVGLVVPGVVGKIGKNGYDQRQIFPSNCPFLPMRLTTDAPDTRTTTALNRIRVRDFVGWTLGIILGVGFGVAMLFPTLPNHLIGRAAVVVSVSVWVGQSVWRHGLNLAAVFGPLPDETGWGLTLAGVAMMDLFGSAEFHVLVPWLEQVAPAFADRYTMSSAGDPTGLTAYLWLITSGVIVAPVLEEFIFRGFLYQRWAYSWGRPVWALVTTAGLFAVVHGHILGTFVFSVVTTLLYLQTRSLWAPITMHAIGNLINIPGVLPLRSGFETVTGIANEHVFGVVCLVIAAPLLIWFIIQLRGALFAPLPYIEHTSERRSSNQLGSGSGSGPRSGASEQEPDEPVATT